MKTCSKCGEEKENELFVKCSGRGDGYTRTCKECKRKYYKSRGKRLKRERDINRYGITVEEYKTMLEAQGGKCAACGISEGEQKRRLAIDHDHKTGKVRGLLCDRCNVALGMLMESEDNILGLLSYLMENK